MSWTPLEHQIFTKSVCCLCGYGPVFSREFVTFWISMRIESCMAYNEEWISHDHITTIDINHNDLFAHHINLNELNFSCSSLKVKMLPVIISFMSFNRECSTAIHLLPYDSIWYDVISYQSSQSDSIVCMNDIEIDFPYKHLLMLFSVFNSCSSSVVVWH